MLGGVAKFLEFGPNCFGRLIGEVLKLIGREKVVSNVFATLVNELVDPVEIEIKYILIFFKNPMNFLFCPISNYSFIFH